MDKKTIKWLHDDIIYTAWEQNKKVEKCSCFNGKRFFFFICPFCSGTGIYLSNEGEKQ